MIAMLPTLVYLLAYVPIDSAPLHRAVAYATVVAIAPREATALGRLARSESRWTPTARSPKNACGLWQQQPRWIPGSTCSDFQRRPILAAVVAVQKSRAMRRICGNRWVHCYQRGPWHRLEIEARRAAARTR